MRHEHRDEFYPADFTASEQDVRNELHKLLFDADLFLGDFLEELEVISNALTEIAQALSEGTEALNSLLKEGGEA